VTRFDYWRTEWIIPVIAIIAVFVYGWAFWRETDKQHACELCRYRHAIQDCDACWPETKP
jgi:hypothetical protein